MSVVSIMNPSPSAALQPAADGRPAGGTARTPGTKTPRKVQWVDDKDSVPAGSTSTHALDEHGLDVRSDYFSYASPLSLVFWFSSFAFVLVGHQLNCN